MRPFLVVLFCSISILLQAQKPVENFDYLWKTFNERYANFDLKQVDWQAMYEKYRPMINEETSNDSLFKVCGRMLQELNDGHVTLSREKNDESIGPPYDFLIEREFPTKEGQWNFGKVIGSTLEDNKFGKPTIATMRNGSRIQFRTSEDYGYFRIDDMEGLSFGALKKTLDQALTAFSSKKGLIIDLRFNGGGWDYTSYKIANRFISEKQVGHYKKTRKKGTEEFTPLKTWYLKPEGKVQFLNKPIIILTSDFTASAAEVFVLAMKTQPNVVLVGDTTEGIFSDMHEFKMPNKWDVTLSHQQFFSAKMVNYEGTGLVPDHKVLNSKEDVKNGADPVILKALEVLAKLVKN